MSERLRNAMEQGERMRHQPSRKETRMIKKRRPAAGWSWNAVEWPTIRSNMIMKQDKEKIGEKITEGTAKNEPSAKNYRRVPTERSGSGMQWSNGREEGTGRHVA